MAGVTGGLAHYWPVKSGVMADVIGRVSTQCFRPLFTADRFGNENGAILASTSANSWYLPNGAYVFGDFTFIAWIKKTDCSEQNYIGEQFDRIFMIWKDYFVLYLYTFILSFSHNTRDKLQYVAWPRCMQQPHWLLRGLRGLEPNGLEHVVSCGVGAERHDG